MKELRVREAGGGKNKREEGRGEDGRNARKVEKLMSPVE